jgi:hypothetical protein
MHRVPNPPKLPLIALAETRSRGGLQVAKARLGVMLLAFLAACVSTAAESRADEGLALLFDTPEKQRGHEADLQDARRRGLIWSAADLLALEDYPADSARQKIFDGQSAALVRWLIARHDPATFIRFLDDAAEVGMEAALDRHYAITSLVSVSSAWKEVAPINTLGLSERRR